MPVVVSRKTFEELVERVVAALPEPFQQALENIAIVIEREPRLRHRRQSPTRGTTVFGFYEGIPLPHRTSSYGMVPPDVITIFQGPLCRAARDFEDLERLVRETVLHELAHYFGIDDERLRALGRY